MTARQTDETDGKERLAPYDHLRDLGVRPQHISAGHGHWWDQLNVRPPDYYLQRIKGVSARNGYTEALHSDVGSGPIPPEVPWSEMSYYQCNCCKDNCINHESTEAAEVRECRV